MSVSFMTAVLAFNPGSNIPINQHNRGFFPYQSFIYMHIYEEGFGGELSIPLALYTKSTAASGTLSWCISLEGTNEKSSSAGGTDGVNIIEGAFTASKVIYTACSIELASQVPVKFRLVKPNLPLDKTTKPTSLETVRSIQQAMPS